VGWQAKPYHDWTGQLYIDWDSTPQDSAFIIHLVYKKFDPLYVKELKNLIDLIKKQPDFTDDSKILVFYIQEEGNLKIKKSFSGLPNVFLHPFKTGKFAQQAAKEVLAANKENIFYITDSVKKISKDSGETNWINQLNGWLSVPEIGMA